MTVFDLSSKRLIHTFMFLSLQRNWIHEATIRWIKSPKISQQWPALEREKLQVLTCLGLVNLQPESGLEKIRAQTEYQNSLHNKGSLGTQSEIKICYRRKTQTTVLGHKAQYSIQAMWTCLALLAIGEGTAGAVNHSRRTARALEDITP